MSPAQEQRQLRFRQPPGSTGILLVRHGESAAATPEAPWDLVDGHGDPPLHAEGRRQAEMLADRLAGQPLAALYVTTLRRTAETAAPLAERLGMSPIVEADLREVFLGEWEAGEYRRHVREGHPLALKAAAEERWDVIPGAEDHEAFASRVRRGIGRIAERHQDSLVAVFTHGGVIGAALAHATGSSRWAFIGADNGSISHVVVTPARWIVRRYNDTTHLGPDLSIAARPAL